MNNQINELEILKAQMSVLKKHLGDNEIISEEMFRATIDSQTRTLDVKRNNYLLGMCLCVMMAIVFVIGQIRTGGMSTWFLALTLVWCMFFAVLNFINYRRNDYDNLLGGTVTETARNVASWRNTKNNQGLVTAVAAAIWVPACLVETWGDITTNIDHAIIVALIFCFVLVTTIGNYLKSRKNSMLILEQIEEFTTKA